MKFLARIEKNRNFWVLLIILFSFFLLRFPSLFEPYWYGDEGIYQVMGMGINEGRLLYKEIWDNKPPLLYLVYALFSSDQFSLRFVSLIFGLFSVVSFYFLVKELFLKSSKKIIYLATFSFSFLFSIPLLEGNIANSENFMLFPIILSSFLVLKVIKEPAGKYLIHNTYYLILSGILLSIAFLFKAVAVFDFAAILLFLLFVNLPNKLKDLTQKKLIEFIKILTPFILSFLIPLALFSLYFLSKGAISEFLSATFVQNVGYVSWGNKFLFSQGLLFLKLFLLASFIFFLFLKRNSLSKKTLFILLWFSFSLFNAFFSQRPFTHYLLVLLPALILFIALISTDKKFKKIAVILSLVIFLLLSKSFRIYGKTLFYYQNFYSFIFNEKTFTDYVSFFDKRTVRDYQIAGFINTHSNKNDNIFVWGNSAQIYKLTNKMPPGRYTVAYHMTSSKKSIEETFRDLKKSEPRFIIVESQKNFIPYSLLGYQEKITINGSIIYERAF